MRMCFPSCRLQAQPEAAPVQNDSMPMLDPIFQCPKCNHYHMCLRTKKDNAGFFLTCLGKPQCTHVLWLADVIKEIRMHDADCPKCHNGNKQIVIKFKSNNILAMLNAAMINDEDRTYTSCILCDNSLRTVLDISASSLRGDQNARMYRAPAMPTQNTNRPNSNANPSRANPPANTRPANNRPPWNAPTNPRPNNNQSHGQVKCSGCHQPATK